MSEAVKAGKKAVRLVNSTVDTTVLVTILLLIVVGCYALWDSKQVYSGAGAARYEIYKPTAEDGGKSFQELQAINPDVFAWLTIYGTHIDYPVVQGPDNMKYVNTNAEGQHSLSGAIFLDNGSSKDFSDFSSILYGHHMEKNAMFGEIGCFAARQYFDARKYGMLYYDGQEHGLEFFAFLHTSAYDSTVYRVDIQGEEAQQAYLDTLLDKATYLRDIKITTDDRIVLLSTCSAQSTNGRDVLIARITDTTFHDPFTKGEQGGSAIAADETACLCLSIPPWVVFIILCIPIMFTKELVRFLKKINHYYSNQRRLNEHDPKISCGGPDNAPADKRSVCHNGVCSRFR